MLAAGAVEPAAAEAAEAAASVVKVNKVGSPGGDARVQV